MATGDVERDGAQRSRHLALADIKTIAARRWESVRWPVFIAAALFAFLVVTEAIDGWIALGSLVVLCLALLVGHSQSTTKSLAGAAGALEGASTGVLPANAGAAVIERLPDPLLLLDTEGRVLLANRAALDLFGTAAPGRDVSSIIRTPDVLEAVQDVLAGAPEREVDYRIPVPVERHFHAHVTAVSNLGSLAAARHGSVSRFVLVLLHDLTALKRVEQMRADFIANASHELKTPLASVSGFVETLRGHARDDDEARERFLGIMAEQAARMRRLIDDMLSLSRIELNEHVRPAGSVDLEGVVNDVVDGLVPQAADFGVEIKISTADALPLVRGDRDELVQVVQNLVDNALKYGRSGGRVEIELTRGENAGQPVVEVKVRDFGPGISREHLPRLTERFYRVDVSKSRERGGTGLGLAIVKHILNRHGGTLSIDSVLDRGSSFTVSLPVSGQA